MTSLLVRPYFFLLKIKTVQEALKHSLYSILLNLPPRRQLLLSHPGPSWRSFSWRDLGVRHHMEISERSRCASGCPDEPRRRGYSPPACAHCQKNKNATFSENAKSSFWLDLCQLLIAGFIDEEFLTPQTIWMHNFFKSSAWFSSLKPQKKVKQNNCPRCNPPYLATPTASLA